MEVWTTSDRRLEGIGTAIFLSLCLARAACTASVCTSGQMWQAVHPAAAWWALGGDSISVPYLIGTARLWRQRSVGGGNGMMRTGWPGLSSPGQWTHPFLEKNRLGMGHLNQPSQLSAEPQRVGQNPTSTEPHQYRINWPPSLCSINLFSSVNEQVC